ncbi:hypothetical protein C7974DRAFT_345517 [Boeremia exigua]|uniref:uncharacterized protein n=1 Tax=Boeremia exigua TaxID=749465 RepID=UPI001E8E9064|nr:uncharacterized protein C7974DRAFT_345517 [Boeremia exigua]KAH6614346.1 hypothetical protein C7974DRAFT_345517 [Boeremia exigua]
MSDPVTYNFYGATIPVLRSIHNSVIKSLRTAKDEQAKGDRPSDEEVLNSAFGDMLPFRVQPILTVKFSLAALKYLELSKVEHPALRSDWKSFDEIIEFFEAANKVLDGVDEKTFNDAAEKSLEVSVSPAAPVLQITGFADHVHTFVIPNSYFHLNAMYMLLRNAGFKLGKGIFLDAFMSEQQKKDWAPLKG